jgi:hypothetical protein
VVNPVPGALAVALVACIALAEMEPGAVIVRWWSYSTPLWYAQRVEGRRLDHGLGDFTTVIDAHLGESPSTFSTPGH